MRLERRVSTAHLDALTHVFDDTNPLHSDPVAAADAGFERPIAHGAIVVCFLSEIIGVRLGMGVPVFCDLRISFDQPFHEGDLLVFDVDPRHRSAALRATTFTFRVRRDDGTPIAHGEFLVKDGVAALKSPSLSASVT